MVNSTRFRILEGALGLLRSGHPVTLESAARQVGLTKPGLMYHFPTKEALLLGLTDHLIDAYEGALMERVPAAPAEVPPVDRIRAYLDWSLGGDFDGSDLVIMTDPRVREPLIKRWTERMGVWLALPDDLPAATRARLDAVRLIADGAWFADATGLFPLPGAERADVRALAETLLKEAE